MGRNKKSDEDELLDGGEDAAPAAPVAPPAAPVVAAAPEKRYVVKARRVTSWFGQMITLEKDDVISDRGYGGQSGIARLRDGGVELEEVK